MGRSRTRRLRPKAPLFPFTSHTLKPLTMNEQTDGQIDSDKSSDKEDTVQDLLGVQQKKPTDETPETDSSNASDGEALNPTDNPSNPTDNTVIDSAADIATSSEESVKEPATTTMNNHDSMCFLKIISSIRSGQKLKQSSSNPNQPISIDKNQWSSSISRWWNGDSRTTSVQVLRKRFNNVFDNIDAAYKAHTNPSSTDKNVFKRSPKDILKDYSRELTGAEKGLRHLCETYKSDIPISSELQVMLESILIRKQTIDNMFTIKKTD